MELIIEVQNVTKIFGKKPHMILKKLKEDVSKDEILKQTGHTIGVDNASFKVEKGEVFVIMGLSGSGKSTLIRCLNLLNRPTAGKVLIENENIVEFDKNQLMNFRQKKAAMVFQHFGLFTHRTVLGNVEYGLEIRGIEKEERHKIAMETLETVGLEGWENAMTSTLSGGMQQRVGLARALANDPDILLMDEPFSALDPLIRREMQLELLDIQSKLKKTVIFITHDVNEAFKLGDRVAVMKDGKIVQIGTPEDILSNPSNEYIEDFVKDIDRTKVIQAENIMTKPTALAKMKDGPKVAIREMKNSEISSLFVVDENLKLQGIITIDDAIRAAKDKKKIKEILKHNFHTCTPETYVEKLIDNAAETKYPIAVTNDSNKLIGIIVRSSILAGLV